MRTYTREKGRVGAVVDIKVAEVAFCCICDYLDKLRARWRHTGRRGDVATAHSKCEVLVSKTRNLDVENSEVVLLQPSISEPGNWVESVTLSLL